MRNIKAAAVVGTTLFVMFMVAGPASASPPSPSAPRVNAWFQPAVDFVWGIFYQIQHGLPVG